MSEQVRRMADKPAEFTIVFASLHEPAKVLCRPWHIGSHAMQEQYIRATFCKSVSCTDRKIEHLSTGKWRITVKGKKPFETSGMVHEALQVMTGHQQKTWHGNEAMP